MRKGILVSAVMLVVVTFSIVAQPARGGRVEDIDSHITRYKTQLNLNDDQCIQLKEILERLQSERQAAGEHPNGDRAAMRKKKEDLHTQTDAAIKEILNKNQLVKFEKMCEEREQRHKQ